jgi:hypothetical protein
MSDSYMMVIAVGLGAIAVVIVSAVDFHAPHRISDIRYATIPERYYFAVIVYASIAAILYLIVLNFFWLVTLHVIAASGAGLILAIPATITTVALIPRLPIVRDIASALRGLMQSLARYPQTVETVTAILARSPFDIGERAVSEAIRELERYGVPPRLINRALANNNEVLTIGAAAMVTQVCSLQISFGELRKDPRLKKFVLVRKDAFDDLDKRYRRMLRRSARALLLADNITVSDLDAGELALEISDFIAQECEDLKTDYQRLLAEAALSSMSNRDARIKLISEFGYRVSLPEPLPFVPLIIIFSLDFLFSIAPLLFLSNLPQGFDLSPRVGGGSALAHAVGLTVSVYFAVYPKAATNFARPSLRGLPWRSYVLFGMVSYLVGTALLSLTYATIGIAPNWPASSHPVSVSALFSLMFLVNTLVLSILLDVRLRNVQLDYSDGRLRDGATHAVVMSATMFILLVALTTLSRVYGIPSLPIELWIYAVIILLFGLLGFTMGYLVPSTAEAYIEAQRFIRRSAEKDGNLLGWATQDYRTQDAVRS